MGFVGTFDHCLTERFSIYQNYNWTIRWWDDHTIVPSSHLMILKIIRLIKVFELDQTVSMLSLQYVVASLKLTFELTSEGWFVRSFE